MLLKVDQKAPEFSSQDQAEMPVSLEDFAGDKNLVLYFYPKDDTSGCTLEAQQFTALAKEFEAADTVVLGVSKDSCVSHQAFIEKYSLAVELLADETGDLCDAYKVWQEKEKNGVKKMGIVRSTFIIDKNSILKDVEYGVKADGHAADVLAKVQAL